MADPRPANVIESRSSSAQAPKSQYPSKAAEKSTGSTVLLAIGR
jgi:hypothetical protein